MKGKNLFIFIAILLCSTYGYAQVQTRIDSNFQQLIESEKQGFYGGLAPAAFALNRLAATVASESIDINFYRCEWEVDPAIRFIKGNVTSYFTITAATNAIVFDLSDTLTVDSILYHGNSIPFLRIGNDGLQLQLPQILNMGMQDSVSIYYNGVPRITSKFSAFNTKLHSGIPGLYTVSEPYGAKEWWPCKNGLTDKADSVEIIITTPAAYNGTSNGVLYKDELQGANRKVYFKHRHPIASYLVCLAATNFVTVTDTVQIGLKKMPLIMNAFPENQDNFHLNSIYATRSIIKFSQLFGEYPFIDEHYAQTEWNIGGGMEHQTNTFVGGTGSQTAAHELAHHWFGDLVTCASWQHIWLNEGFADYAQFLYVQNFDTSLIHLHLLNHLKLAVAQPGGSVFVSDTSDPSRIFNTNLSYDKGGYVLHMLRGILGDSIFFAGLRSYLQDPLVRNKFATTADLERNLELISGKDLKSFFQKWIYGEGYPNYNCTWVQNSNHWAKVQIYQSTSHNSVSFYEMPVPLRFKNSVRDTTIIVFHQENGQVFWVNPGFEADSMLLDPDLWILAKDRLVTKGTRSGIAQNEIYIFPNPAPAMITISLLNPIVGNLSIQVYNIAGQLVQLKNIKIEGFDLQINLPLTDLARGIYFLVVTEANNRKTIKKIIH